MKRMTLKSLGIAALVTAFISCGSAGTGNDQGVAFTLFGTYTDASCGTGLTGLSIPVSLSDQETNGSGTAGYLAAVGLQNNTAQTIRTRRVFIKYYVEGATIQPPSTSQALGIYLGPGTINDNSSLPDSITGGSGNNNGGDAGLGAASTSSATLSTRALANSGCAEFQPLPAEILSYLSMHRDSLPQMPYKMRAELQVYGIGSAGDEYVTNPLDLFIEILEDNIITPTAGGDTSDATSLGSIDESGTEIISVDDL